MKRILQTLLFLAATSCLLAAEPRVLVYTRNLTPDGKGYVHENIATSVATLKEPRAASGFEVDASDNPACIPDHAPQMSCAAPWHADMAFALGFMKAGIMSLEEAR